MLRSLCATGHAGWEVKGRDIVCAAASSLIRTAAGLLHSEAEVVSAGESPVLPGRLLIRVESASESILPWLDGIRDFLVKGLLDLEREFPRNIEIAIIDERITEEQADGS